MTTDSQFNIPSWMDSSQANDSHTPEVKAHEPITLSTKSKHLLTKLDELAYESMFESVLDQLSSGIGLIEIFNADIRNHNVSKFIRWVHRDPDRKSRYYNAQEIGSEVVGSEMLLIADGVGSLEDVARSKLRIDTRKYMLGVWNKKRFGETKQIDIGGTISISAALAAANSRVARIINDPIEAEIIEELSTAPPELLTYQEDEED